jgi:hypothetical protein
LCTAIVFERVKVITNEFKVNGIAVLITAVNILNNSNTIPHIMGLNLRAGEIKIIHGWTLKDLHYIKRSRINFQLCA